MLPRASGLVVALGALRCLVRGLTAATQQLAAGGTDGGAAQRQLGQALRAGLLTAPLRACTPRDVLRRVRACDRPLPPQERRLVAHPARQVARTLEYSTPFQEFEIRARPT